MGARSRLSTDGKPALGSASWKETRDDALVEDLLSGGGNRVPPGRASEVERAFDEVAKMLMPPVPQGRRSRSASLRSPLSRRPSGGAISLKGWSP